MSRPVLDWVQSRQCDDLPSVGLRGLAEQGLQGEGRDWANPGDREDSFETPSRIFIRGDNSLSVCEVERLLLLQLSNLAQESTEKAL